ncbi:MAG: peptidoglycan DD-metalloendopeptidase family protein [Myxococcota bacterium]
MDRPASKERAGDPNWLFVMVPTDVSQPVERVQVASRQLRRWKTTAAVAGTLGVCLLVAVAFAWPRSMAYGSLVQENLELKQRLEAVDRKMGEVDKIMFRLRLYDAQLESLGAPLGDNGPVPPDSASNAWMNDQADDAPGLGQGDDDDAIDLGEETPGAPGDGTPDEGGEWGADDGGPPDGVAILDEGGDTEEGVRSAQAWAEGIEGRADAFLTAFADTEPHLNLLMEELESLDSLERSLPSLWPVTGYLASGYGWRRNPFGVKWKHHAGIDISGNLGAAIHAAADGRVLRAGRMGGYGIGLEIDHGYGVTTLYGHTQELYVRPGQYVRRGEKVAKVGSTGRSTGPHLHFEVRLDGHPVDPLQYLLVPKSARRGRGAAPIQHDDIEGAE